MALTPELPRLCGTVESIKSSQLLEDVPSEILGDKCQFSLSMCKFSLDVKLICNRSLNLRNVTWSYLKYTVYFLSPTLKLVSKETSGIIFHG